MDAYLKLQRAEYELDLISHRVADFLKKSNREIKNLDLTKIDILNPKEVLAKLLEVKTLAQQLAKTIRGYFTMRQYTYGTKGQPDTYAYGRVGQLKGKYKPLLDQLDEIDAHMDILATAAAANNTQAQTLVTLAEVRELSADMAKKFGKDAAYLEGMGMLFVIAGLFTVALRKLK